MRFADLLLKMGKGQRLSDLELNQMVIEARQMEEASSLVKSWVNAGTAQSVFNPGMELIYSKILLENAATLTLDVPPNFKHLMLFTAGTNTNAGVSWRYLYGKVNGDAGANYTWMSWFGVDGLTDEGQGVSTGLPIGGLADDGSTNEMSANVTFIPSYNVDKYKRAITLWAAYGNYPVFSTAAWLSTAPIKSIQLLTESPDSIAAGSIITLYGIR